MITLLLLHGCIAEPPRYVYGEDLDALELVLWTRSVGVHPDVSVLDDPNNPFGVGMDSEVKWALTSDGAWIPAFYAWATTLATVPTGEAQFYTARALAEVYTRQLAAPEDRYHVWRLAVAGNQAVLDDFPDSVTYDAAGLVAYPLAPLAWQAILDLGGEPEGGWVEVATADGGSTVVQVP